MKIDSNGYPVKPEKKLKLAEWPAIVQPVFKSKKQYRELLAEHVERWSDLQRPCSNLPAVSAHSCDGTLRTARLAGSDG